MAIRILLRSVKIIATFAFVLVAATIQMLLNLMYMKEVLAMLTMGERTAERECTTETLKIKSIFQVLIEKFKIRYLNASMWPLFNSCL